MYSKLFNKMLMKHFHHLKNLTSPLKNYILLNLGKACAIISLTYWSTSLPPSLSGEINKAAPLSWSCSQGLSIDSVGISLMIVIRGGRKIRVWHKSKGSNWSIYRDNCCLEGNQRTESKWSSVWFKGNVPVTRQPPGLNRLPCHRGTIQRPDGCCFYTDGISVIHLMSFHRNRGRHTV